MINQDHSENFITSSTNFPAAALFVTALSNLISTCFKIDYVYVQFKERYFRGHSMVIITTLYAVTAEHLPSSSYSMQFACSILNLLLVLNI